MFDPSCGSYWSVKLRSESVDDVVVEVISSCRRPHLANSSIQRELDHPIPSPSPLCADANYEESSSPGVDDVIPHNCCHVIDQPPRSAPREGVTEHIISDLISSHPLSKMYHRNGLFPNPVIVLIPRS